jgi:dephospho-CoA kinase
MTALGVTGGFCTGKTTVSALFRKLGARAIDADKIVHALYKRDKKIKHAVLKNFGKGVFTAGGKIDRKKLKRLAFKTRKGRSRLCGITHPAVIRKIKEEVRLSKHKVVVVDAPLLIETRLYKVFDYVAVVKASLAKQIARGRRRGFKKQDVLAIRKLQMPLGKKIKYADFVIDNNRSREYTRKQVIKIWSQLNRR